MVAESVGIIEEDVWYQSKTVTEHGRQKNDARTGQERYYNLQVVVWISINLSIAQTCAEVILGTHTNPRDIRIGLWLNIHIVEISDDLIAAGWNGSARGRVQMVALSGGHFPWGRLGLPSSRVQ